MKDDISVPGETLALDQNGIQLHTHDVEREPEEKVIVHARKFVDLVPFSEILDLATTPRAHQIHPEVFDALNGFAKHAGLKLGRCRTPEKNWQVFIYDVDVTNQQVVPVELCEHPADLTSAAVALLKSLREDGREF